MLRRQCALDQLVTESIVFKNLGLCMVQSYKYNFNTTGIQFPPKSLDTIIIFE